MPPRHYIVIAGSIGTGKTSVCHLLKQNVDCAVFYEKRDVFLESYYAEPEKFAFLNQLSYSIQFLEQAAHISTSLGMVVQDRSIYDTHGVFSRMQLTHNRISDAEFSLLDRLFRIADQLARPSLLILLDASEHTAFNRMRKRACVEERGVTIEYLTELRTTYLRWFDEFSLCKKRLISSDALSPESIVREILGDIRVA
jgi:deoxyadenosine/deoxycytidine kinase